MLCRSKMTFTLPKSLTQFSLQQYRRINVKTGNRKRKEIMNTTRVVAFDLNISNFHSVQQKICKYSVTNDSNLEENKFNKSVNS